MISRPSPSAQPTALPPPDLTELAGRRRAALAAAQAAGLDGLIVWGRGSTNVDGCADLLYLTRHLTAVSHIPDGPGNRARGHAALVLAPGREPVLVTDSYDLDPSELGLSEVRLSTEVDRDTARAACDLGLGGHRVGLAGQTGLLHSAAACLAHELGGATQVSPADDLIARLRLVKSPAEVALLREASRLGCTWMEVMLAAALPGRTEGEVVGEGLRWLAAAGGWAYDVAIASGPVAHRYRHRQALPTWDSGRRLESGDLLHIDAWGPMAHGYFCDLTRSTVVGEAPSAKQRSVLEDAVELVQTLIGAVRPGRTLREVHAAGAAALARRGGDASGFSAMIPFFGHSLGLECERPFITATADEVIVPNMVLALECFLAEGPGVGAGFEHVVLVKSDGVEVLTHDAAERPWASA
jgi:Xaa-Pro dipeptidase